MKSNIRSSIIDWDNRFPLDRWWRKKYNVSYLSEEHRKSTFFNQYFEFHEDKLYEEFFEKDQKEKEGLLEAPYIPLSGNWWRGKKVSKKEVDDWFKAPI